MLQQILTVVGKIVTAVLYAFVIRATFALVFGLPVLLLCLIIEHRCRF